MFAARIKKFVGAYAALMEGIDMIVFTGGIGENDPGTRERVSKGLEFMGVKFDPEVNRGVRGKDVVLSAPDSRVKVVTIATNEELVIASDKTLRIIRLLRRMQTNVRKVFRNEKNGKLFDVSKDC